MPIPPGHLLAALCLAAAAPLAAGQTSGFTAPDVKGLADTVAPQPSAPPDSGPNAPPSQPSGLGSPTTVTLGAATTVSPGLMDPDVLASWSYWWYFNREPLLDLQKRWGARVGPTIDEIDALVRPTLLQLTRAEYQDSVRATAGIALARLAVSTSAATLSSSSELAALARMADPQLAEESLFALGLVGDYPAFELLAGTLADSPRARKHFGQRPATRQRAFAAYALGVMGAQAAHEGLRLMVTDKLWPAVQAAGEHRDVRIAAINAISQCRLAWEPEGRAVDADSPLDSRDALLARLTRLLANEKDEFVRAHLPVAIARLSTDAPPIKRKATIETFVQRLGERRGLGKLEADGLVIGLGIMGTAWGRAEDELLRNTLFGIAAGSKDSPGRHHALMALSRVAANAGQALAPQPVRTELEGFLAARLQSGSPEDRAWAAMAAGALSARLLHPQNGRTPVQAGEPLLIGLRQALAEEATGSTLCAIVLALGLAEDAPSAPAIEALLATSKNAHVRGYAALALGLIGRADAEEAILAELLSARGDSTSLEHTAIGLALLNRRRASDVLLARISTANSGRQVAPLAAALGRTADAGSLEPLIALALNKQTSIDARANLTLAIGLIGDTARFSWRTHLATDVHYQAWTPTLVDQAGYGVLNIF